MRVIAEERLKEILVTIPDDISGRKYLVLLLEQLIEEECKEIDTLITNEPDVILAAEKYAEMYDGDDRQDIKTDVLNSFYHGAFFKRKNQGDTLTVSKLRPMSELSKNANSVMAAYEDERGDIYFDITSSQCIEDEYSFSSEEYIGWIPLPIYKPE